ncbi:Uncharacterized short protein YbdD, DUF466 family [Marininema mesophilum]|uniref:Uncharacterized short protein YbdD, DUF466 family n=1 Tax=Marininema mesophilum TaxID=1048340 RepID=A0A1H2WAI7_9BACL|nr:YbdD/YjiX family protein [Marininema mesophilum]SDW77600.1 Uncharacterized short protein YbdD, DUF466 family [Marininema mesophilum]
MSSILHSCIRAVHGVADYLNAIAGVPNYERYLEHFKREHPGETPLTEKEFHKKATDEKYGGGSIRRCC